MAERVLVTIHDAIPADAFRGLNALAKKMREPGDSEAYLRQTDESHGEGRPVFELFVTTGDEETTA